MDRSYSRRAPQGDRRGAGSNDEKLRFGEVKPIRRDDSTASTRRLTNQPFEKSRKNAAGKQGAYIREPQFKMTSA